MIVIQVVLVAAEDAGGCPVVDWSWNRSRWLCQPLSIVPGERNYKR